MVRQLRNRLQRMMLALQRSQYSSKWQWKCKQVNIQAIITMQCSRLILEIQLSLRSAKMACQHGKRIHWTCKLVTLLPRQFALTKATKHMLVLSWTSRCTNWKQVTFLRSITLEACTARPPTRTLTRLTVSLLETEIDVGNLC